MSPKKTSNFKIRSCFRASDKKKIARSHSVSNMYFTSSICLPFRETELNYFDKAPTKQSLNVNKPKSKRKDLVDWADYRNCPVPTVFHMPWIVHVSGERAVCTLSVYHHKILKWEKCYTCLSKKYLTYRCIHMLRWTTNRTRFIVNNIKICHTICKYTFITYRIGRIS